MRTSSSDGDLSEPRHHYFVTHSPVPYSGGTVLGFSGNTWCTLLIWVLLMSSCKIKLPPSSLRCCCTAFKAYCCPEWAHWRRLTLNKLFFFFFLLVRTSQCPWWEMCSLGLRNYYCRIYFKRMLQMFVIWSESSAFPQPDRTQTEPKGSREQHCGSVTYQGTALHPSH